jgi:hypothetical protein
VIDDPNQGIHTQAMPPRREIVQDILRGHRGI